MKTNDMVLTAIRARQQKQSGFGYGIIMADQYVSTLRDRVGMDTCYKYASKGRTSFNDVLVKAAETLVYSNSDMVVEEIKDAAGLKTLRSQFTFPKDTLIAFTHKLTTPRLDRDGDILRSEGALPDPKMLLLWQHVPTLPIGKMVGVVEHSKDCLKVVSAIVDMNDLCHDSAVMVDNDMGRFSHGFRALEFEEIREDGSKEPIGFDVKRFEVMEESLVSVPSNTDAETEEVFLSLVEGGKLKSPLMKRYGKSIRELQPKTVPVGIDLKLTVNGKEIGNAGNDTSGEAEGGEEGRDGGPPVKEDADASGTEGAEEGTEDAKGSEDGGEVKYFDGNLEGRWESTTQALHRGAKSFLSGKGLGVKEDDWIFLAATFPNYAVICWEVSDDGTKRYFKTSWIQGENGPEFTGEPKEVKLSVELENVEKQNRPEETKAGRVLSKSNEYKIRDAVEAINEVVGMDIPRPAKATLREASTGLETVLKSLGTEEEEETKQIGLTAKEVMAFLIFQSTKEQRQRFKGALEVVDKNEQQKRTAEEVRSLLGS